MVVLVADGSEQILESELSPLGTGQLDLCTDEIAIRRDEPEMGETLDGEDDLEERGGAGDRVVQRGPLGVVHDSERTGAVRLRVSIDQESLALGDREGRGEGD